MQILRLLRISRVLISHGLDELVISLHLFRPYRFVLHLMPWRWRRRSDRPRGERVRRALEELGPVFVKFGQMLSTRPDLLPDDIAEELTKLQDRVPPFSATEARAIIERAYGESVTVHLRDFDDTAIASASVAQVHAAKLHDGTEVVVKVIRPGVAEVIDRDIALLYTLARMAQRYWSEGARLRPVEIVDDYNKTIHDELDLMREGANASQLRSNFKNSDLIYVPKVYWDHTRRDVMVMERIDGISIRDVERLREAGIDMRKLAHDGVEIFFTQAFRHGFFHADMHPGNIFVAPDGQYRAVDFGIMGTLGDADKRYLAENFLAFFNRDYRAVAEAHLRAGWVPASTRVEEFEAAIRTVCEPIFAKPISEISFGRLVIRLFQTARRFNMPVQTQLVLLQKTLLNIEGLGRRLYPELDLWQTAKPFLERWMNEQVGPRAAFHSLKRDLPKWGGVLPEMPLLAHDFLRRVRDDELVIKMQSDEIGQLHSDLRSGLRRLFYGLIGSSLMLGAMVLAALDGYAPQMVFGAPWLSWVFGALGAVILVAVWPTSRGD
ncbi:MAG: ubiquinone biosynthesis regulatory protein kinase UbiB [Gammaproteobacteria bacterium]|nr:ubiquinone biosynthesis regulatory protein kinase UbiB [Gammaproteobacteria bacterium]MDH3468680.1 ubiquinone biosynthesis regulatory protein kinase UbiB [Gammaproteobacteria bacterium]